MAYIGKKPEDLIKGNATYNAFTGDGSTTTYDVTNLLPDGGQFDVEVFVDNVRQEAGSSKSYTIGQDGSGDLKRITFNVAPDNGSEIYVINPGRETALITVADNTITTAKLQDDAVTTAKITDSNVTTAKIAADAITGAKIADDAINSEHITDGSVDNVHLAGSIANAKLANSSITINGTAVSLGGSVTAGTDWQAVVVADGSTTLNAVAGRGYFLDTNTGVIEVFLPSSPTRGDTIVLADYSGTFSTNKVLINTGGKNIDSTELPGEFELTTNNTVLELVFVDNDKGWLAKQNEATSGPSLIAGGDYIPESYIAATGGTVATSGNFKIHTFTGDGCFVVSCGGNSKGSNKVSYLVVAGGGGGGGDSGGGGGAGGHREGKASSTDTYTASPLNAPDGLPVSAQTYPITVGGGGGGGSGNPGSPGVSGSNSVFSTITSAGGGGGGPGGPTGTGQGLAGGSGGGGGRVSPGGAGSGNTPPVSPPQGANGGANGPGDGGAGGGGATQAGTNNNGTDGGVGGAGATSSINATPTARAGGGGGGSTPNTSTPPVSGGSGGGGAGAGSGSVNGTAASANTGGGGGAGSASGNGAGAAGGRGIVIIRYKFQSG